MEQIYSEADWVSAPPVSDDAEPYEEKVVYNSDLIKPKKRRTGREMYLPYSFAIILAGLIGSFIVSHGYSVENGFKLFVDVKAVTIVAFATLAVLIASSVMLFDRDFDLS